MAEDNEKTVRSEEEWRAVLTPEEYAVLREKGTERPFTGTFNAHYENGVYTCRGCGNPLFSSQHKYNSGSGWPSFDRAIAEGRIEEHRDTTYGMIRTEITCARCGGHLGHVFPDGPDSTGMRYCVNSLSLGFESGIAAEEAGDAEQA